MICCGCWQEKKEMMSEGTAVAPLCYDCFNKLRERSFLKSHFIARTSKASIHYRILRMELNDKAKEVKE